MLVRLAAKFSREGTKLPQKGTDLWLMKWPTHLTSSLIENHGIHGTQVSFSSQSKCSHVWNLKTNNLFALYSFITRRTEGCRNLSWRCFHSPICDRDMAWSVLLWNHHQTATQSNQNSWYHQTGPSCPKNIFFDWLHRRITVQLASVSSEIGTANSWE